jgi:hypothetical protein
VKATAFLRLASILALLACLGHTFLFVTYVPSHGPQETAVVTAMKEHRFNFGGFTHSYWELYFGYGLFVSIGCFVECVLFWQLGDLAKSAVPSFKWILMPLILGEGAYSLLMLKYFFLIPIVVHISTAISLILAFVAAVSSSPMTKAFTQAAGPRRE